MDKTHELYMDVQYGSFQKGPLETGCKQSLAPSGSMLKFLKSCVKCICKFCPTNKNEMKGELVGPADICTILRLNGFLVIIKQLHMYD